ncbi:MAG TPA: transcriptional regulator [Chloroflexi bacterium]|nr:transcriptional regulator [Chloroflexota bacterium]
MSEQDLQQLLDLAPLLVPVLLIQLGLIVAALVDLIKRSKTRGPKWLWVVIILIFGIIGPIIYFLIGREDE